MIRKGGSRAIAADYVRPEDVDVHREVTAVRPDESVSGSEAHGAETEGLRVR